METSDPRNRRSLDYPNDRFHLGSSPAWSPTGNLLSALGGGSGYARTILQWNFGASESLVFDPDIAAKWDQHPRSKVQDVLTCLTYSPDGRVLAVGNQAGNIILIDSGSGDVLRFLKAVGGIFRFSSWYSSTMGRRSWVTDSSSCGGSCPESGQPNKPSVLFQPVGEGFVMSANGELGASVRTAIPRSWFKTSARKRHCLVEAEAGRDRRHSSFS